MTVVAGSPPQVRGKLGCLGFWGASDGITPAGAGKTLSVRLTPSAFQDHPRGCGENSRISHTRLQPTGITPADAGKTATAQIDFAAFKDHPRGCGENRTRNRVRFFFPGSPPRMRGKPLSLFLPPQLRQDHPRGCGENLHADVRYVKGAGSPPRMRGKRIYPTRYLFGTGITPADAGKTLRRTVRRPFAKDHPRGCGENSECLCRAVCGVGSPPRMRGKQIFCLPGYSQIRITPADAGKTCL